MFNDGALFYTGDPHGVQGDGEVDGGALEQSLTATLQFVLHKGAGAAMRGPRAEDAANYYALGLDLDLNTAMKTAVRETVELLQEKGGVTAAEAYAIASMGVDFKVAEAVDSVQLIYGTVPKRFFKEKPAYWGNGKESSSMRLAARRAGCADRCCLVLPGPAAAKFENVRRIGVISAIGDVFTVQKIGITAFGNDVKEMPIGSWNIDSLVIGRIRAALASRFEVRPVRYRVADFPVGQGNIFNSTESKIAAAVRQASPQGLDAYVVVTKDQSVWPQTNQLMEGLGIVERASLGSSTVKVFAFIRIR